MNVDKLTENIVDQIKEAQIKLGYAKETVRLYYPAESLCTLMGMEPMDTKRLLDYLKETAVLSEIPFEVLFLFESPQAPLYCSCLFPYPAHLLRTPWFFPIPPSPARSRFP